MAVDKANKTLFYFEKRSPLTMRQAFPSIHGQAEGDKQVRGDLRTPEGVYFVTGKVREPLDFEEYGSQAHALNYPNPVDKLRGKTGSGIWIHSKGRPIANQTTRGCIAVDLADIDALAPHLVPGTPVVVAENIVSDVIQPTPDVKADVAAATPATEAMTRLLTEKTEAWNKAWASRSEAMFDFYDPDAYTRAQDESFSAFRAQKEQLFQRFPWIQIQYGEINVLQGPGYWVSWFKQYYRAPNLSTEGIRRLYWQPVKNGELKIVGMEWLPQDLGMERAYLDSLAPSVVAFVEEWRQAWERGDLEAYASYYAKDAVQDGQRGLEAITARKKRTWGLKEAAGGGVPRPARTPGGSGRACGYDPGVPRYVGLSGQRHQGNAALSRGRLLAHRVGNLDGFVIPGRRGPDQARTHDRQIQRHIPARRRFHPSLAHGTDPCALFALSFAPPPRLNRRQSVVELAFVAGPERRPRGKFGPATTSGKQRPNHGPAGQPGAVPA